jgi:hypothetical protein
MERNKKEIHGGSRTGAGRKKKYATETIRIYLTVPSHLADELKRDLKKFLNREIKKRF